MNCPFCGFCLLDLAGLALLDLPSYPKLFCPGCHKEIEYDWDETGDFEFYWWVHPNQEAISGKSQ